MGLLDQKFLLCQHTLGRLYINVSRQRGWYVSVFLTYSSSCLCGTYIMAHGTEAFPKTQVTSAHHCTVNDTVSVEMLNLTGPESFVVNGNQCPLGKFAAVCSLHSDLLSVTFTPQAPS